MTTGNKPRKAQNLVVEERYNQEDLLETDGKTGHYSISLAVPNKTMRTLDLALFEESLNDDEQSEAWMFSQRDGANCPWNSQVNISMVEPSDMKMWSPIGISSG